MRQVLALTETSLHSLQGFRAMMASPFCLYVGRTTGMGAMPYPGTVNTITEYLTM